MIPWTKKHCNSVTRVAYVLAMFALQYNQFKDYRLPISHNLLSSLLICFACIASRFEMMLNSLPKEAFMPNAMYNNWANAHTSNQHHNKDEFHAETDSEGAMSEKGYEDTPPRKSFASDISVYSVSSIQTCVMEPRSVAISSPVLFKCRQLPCRTFISTGSCPYGDRCVFLHCVSCFVYSIAVFMAS